jgi:hypothetical protein
VDQPAAGRHLLGGANPCRGATQPGLFGRWSWWPLASALIVFNYVLLYGFVNYIAGVPVAIALAAGWILLRERPMAFLLPSFALGALILFFFHLYAFAIYGVLILCHEVRLLLRRAEAD